jgi:hypothetical protein
MAAPARISFAISGEGNALTRLEVLFLLVRHCLDRLKAIFMKWPLSYAFGSHAGEWLALGVTIVFAFALCIASLKVVFWLLTRERDTDEPESEYWRIHGGK